MIPKVIHYVWVGPTKKSSQAKRCIESWKKFCPDYKIIEWNEKALQSIKNQYLEEAYEAGKWAFVSDVLRLYALLSGGIYIDTDVELTGNLDGFLNHSFFMCFEYNPSIRSQIKAPSTALIGSSPNNSIIRKVLEEYGSIHFQRSDGTYDLTTNVVRFQHFFQNNFPLIYKKASIDRKLELAPGVVVYPYYYFCYPNDKKNNYAIHHFEGSWLPPISRKIILELHSEVFKFLNILVVGFRKNKTYKAGLEWPPKTSGRVLFKLPWLRDSLIVIYRNC